MLNSVRNNMKAIFSIQLVSCGVLFILASCVGTIEDTKLEKTKTAKTKIEKLPFSGLNTVKPVSHDKVEVNFYAANGKPEAITYEIYVNETEAPIFVSGSSLTPNPKGQLIYTVSGLQVNTTYSFAVSAKNNETGARSDSGTSLFAKTFANITADFNGISNVRLPNGTAGQNTVVVEWVPAVTKGTPTAPKNPDPVGYEIIYIGEDGGASNINNPNYTGSDRFVSLVPGTFSNPPLLVTERYRLITGLVPGKKYYFQVRAYHKGYVIYGGVSGDPNYKREENNQFLSVTTRLPTGIYDFDPLSVNLRNPDGETALTAIDVVWTAATGDFDHYRVFKASVTSDSDPDALTETDIDTKIGIADFISVSADDIFVRLTSLASYTPYQVKVVACKLATCLPNERVISAKTTLYTNPVIAPFDGIDHIDHPRDETSLNRIHTVFSPPVTATGYLTDLKLYCYSSSTDVAPVQINYAKDTIALAGVLAGATTVDTNDTAAFPATGAIAIGVYGAADYEIFIYTSKTPTSFIGATGLAFAHVGGDDVAYTITGKAGCNGLVRGTASPTSISGFETFSEIAIDNIEPSIGNQYCLSVVPVIDGDNTFGYVDYENLPSAIVKCIVPEIKTPTLQEFPGKSSLCQVTDRSLKVSWTDPTAGMFNRYQVFWKKNDGTPFSFADAVATATPTGPEYFTADNISILTYDYTIPDLIPGQRYYTGTLTYIDGAPRYYSEYNLHTNDCLIPLPVADFNEWTNLFAIGPKIDGLTPPDVAGNSSYIMETLDNAGIPVEVKLDPADINGEAIDALFYLNRGSSNFDGVYGTRGADSAIANKFQYSNSGVISLAWKDVKFYAGTLSLKDLISFYETGTCIGEAPPGSGISETSCIAGGGTWTAPVKKYRTYGYKVYRSDDNKITWKELTNKSYAFQSTNNGGPVRANVVNRRPRNNVATTPEDIVSFTDYSVKFAKTTSEIERGRVYWYKIVPIFNGTPLAYSDSENIIKVTLPPPNMALVHRRMANRTICNEMNRAINKTPGAHYSCNFRGVGASGLTTPWEADKMVYDLGGDLLVDRFELGCNFSRGSNVNPSKSDYDPSNLATFQGLTGTYIDTSPGANFKGCVGVDSWPGVGEYEPMAGHPGPGNFQLSTTFKKARQGDCYGRFSASLAYYKCVDDTKTSKYAYTFPGSLGGAYNCQGSAQDSYYGVQDAADVPNYNVGAPSGTADDGYEFQKKLVQSEYAAVYWNRDRTGGYMQREWPGSTKPAKPQGWLRTNSNNVGPWSGGSCYVNLPIQNFSGAGNHTARWVPVSRLVRNNIVYDNTVDPVVYKTLIDKTVNQILADPELYDSGTASSTLPPNTTRYDKNVTPLAKIVTSNNAKLPPLANLSQEDFHNICGLYKVELGTYSDTTSTFYQLSTPTSKRLMRKKEFNVAAAWPEVDANTGVPNVDTYDEVMVTDIEKGTYNHTRIDNSGLHDDSQGCNGLNKLTGIWGDSLVGWDTDITPKFTDRQQRPYLLTGSSPNDPGALDINTQKCVSKFGIQDLVGNMMEHVSEQYFCDFTGEQMYLGPSAAQATSISLYVTSEGAGPTGPVPGPVNGTFTGGNRNLVNTLYNSLTLIAWDLPFPNTGTCSVVEWGGARGGNYAQGNLINSIFAAGGGYEPTIVEASKAFDQDAILDSRNGDGYFLDFGQGITSAAGNLGPPIGLVDAVQIKLPGGADNRRGKYFSVALGMVLECTDPACPPYATPVAATNDNKLFTTAEMVLKFGLIPGDFDIADFPINNGDAHNRGLGELSTYLEYTSPNALNQPFDYISAVSPGASVGDPADDTWEWTHADGVADIVSGSRTYWSVARNNPMYTVVGGDVYTTDSGRYYSMMEGTTQGSQENTFTRGARCALKINIE